MIGFSMRLFWSICVKGGVSESASHGDEGWVKAPKLYFSGLVEGERCRSVLRTSVPIEVNDAVRRSIMGWPSKSFCFFLFGLGSALLCFAVMILIHVHVTWIMS